MAHNLTSLRNLHIDSLSSATLPALPSPASISDGSGTGSLHALPGVADQPPKITTRNTNSSSASEDALASSLQEVSNAFAQARIQALASRSAGSDAQTAPENTAKNSSSTSDGNQDSLTGPGKTRPHTLKDLMDAANQGQPEAQLLLSTAFLVGNGVPQSLAKAHEWLSKAAEQGHPYACHTLGVQHYVGFGVVSQDHTKAFNLFKRAADQKDCDAMYMLAECYRDGAGVKQDMRQCLKWLSAAANGGHAEARILLDTLSSASRKH